MRSRRSLISPVCAWLICLCLASACGLAPATPTPVSTATAPAPGTAVSAAASAAASQPPAATPAPTSGPALTPTPNPPAATPAAATPAASATLGATSRGRAENFTLVGRDPLNGRGWNAGLALSASCAYVGNRRLPEIAIVDVSDPAQPKAAGNLSLAPGLTPVEVRALPDLNLLVVLNFAPNLSLMTFDVSDCFHPRPLASLALGGSPHEFYLWRDPAQPGRVLAFVAMWGHQQTDLQVADLSDPAAPKVIGTWSAPAAGAAGTLHSISLSPDGQRAYLSMWEGGFLLADSSDFAQARPRPALRLLNAGHPLLPPPGVDVHSAVPLAGSNDVLLTQEVYSCPFGGLAVADIRDPAQPRLEGAFNLPENTASACPGLPEADAVFTAHNPLVVGSLAFVSWYGGGLQALDISHPAQPVRAGLFVPAGEGPAGGSPYGRYPVQVWSYPILRGGLIYVSDIETGLYILRYTGPGAAALNGIALAQGNASWSP